MRVLIGMICLLCLITSVYADESLVALEKASVNLHDKASIQRGAKFFATICMACHTLIYMRYDPVAKAAGITYEKMPVNIKEWPNGIKPPDLSLEASARGADWIYTYLHSFYFDPSRPTGVNNLVFPNTAMAPILAPYQGQLILAKDQATLQKNHFYDLEWYDMLQLQQQGTLSPDEFDRMTNDIVTFLVYAANPYQNTQRFIGMFVLGFLIVLFVLMVLLKKAYWQDIKK